MAVPNLNIPDLLAHLDSQYAAANNAGLERYRNLMGTVDQTGAQVNGLYDQAFNLMGHSGEAERARIASGAVRDQASASQGLISRGLGNTTIRSAAMRGVRSDANRAIADVNERVSGQQAGLLTQRAGSAMSLGGMKGDAILSRQDMHPDASMYASLIQSLMANGGGGAPGRSYNFVGLSSGQMAAPNSFVSRANADWGQMSGTHQAYASPARSGVQTFRNDSY